MGANVYDLSKVRDWDLQMLISRVSKRAKKEGMSKKEAACWSHVSLCHQEWIALRLLIPHTEGLYPLKLISGFIYYNH